MIQIFIETDLFGKQDITERVSSWSFSHRLGVGFDQAEVEITAPERDLWALVDADAQSGLEFHGWGQVLWKGKFAGPQMAGATMRLYAEGAGVRLGDTELWRIYSDAEYGRWKPPARVPDGFSVDNNNRLYLACEGGFDTGDEAYLVYPDTGVDLGGDLVKFAASVTAEVVSGRWLIGLRADDGTVIWSRTAQGLLYIEGTDYDLDLVNGKIMALSTGSITDGQELALSYRRSNIVSDEIKQANLDVWVSLDNVPREETVVVRGAQTYVEGGGADYTLNYTDGKFYAVAGGNIVDGQEVLCNYTYVEEVSDEQIFANLDLWVDLAYPALRAGSVVVKNAATGFVYTETTDYDVDYTNGKIKALSTGTIDDGRRLHVDYDYDAVIVDEAVEANTGARALLAHQNINAGSFSARGTDPTPFTPGSDYTVNYSTGKLMAASTGTITDGQELRISYHYEEDVVEIASANLDVWVQLAENYQTAGTVIVTSAAAATLTYAIDEDLSDESGLEFFMQALQDGPGDASVAVTDVVTRTMEPCTNGLVVGDILTGESIQQADVRTGIAVDNAAFQGDSLREAVEAMAEIGDGEEPWLFVIYENGAELRAWSGIVDWRLERDNLDSWDVEWRREDVVNAVRAETPDGTRTAWVVDADSVTQWGRREETIQIPMTTDDEAERLAAIYLDEHAWPVAGLNLSAGARVRRTDGSLLPAWLVRAGDVLVLHDLIPDRQVTIRVEEVNATADGVKVTPLGSEARLETVLARMERQRQEAMTRTAAMAATMAGRGGGVLAASSGGGDHDAVTLAAGSDPALTLSGQELALAPVVSAADLTAHAALPNVHHAAVTLAAGSNNSLGLSGQELDLDDDLTDIRSIEFDLAPGLTPAEGRVYWDATYKTLVVGASGGAINMRLGLEKYAGVVTKPSYTDNGDGSVTIGSGVYRLHSASTGNSVVLEYALAGGTFTLTDGVINYIYVSYNAGSPAVLHTVTRSDISSSYLTTTSPIYTIYRAGTVLYYLDWDTSGLAAIEKLLLRIINTQRFQRESGLALSDSGSQQFQITSGVVWYGLNNESLDAVDSATDDTNLMYWDGAQWVESNVRTFNNSQYQTPAGLASLSPNRYAVNWVYRAIAHGTKRACILLGEGDYKLSDAQESTVPASIPAGLQSIGMLVGRIIVMNGDTAATQVDSAFEVILGTSGAVEHNDLSGLQGGDGTDYYHLPAPTRGAVAIGNSSSEWDGLGSGNAGEFLGSDGTDVTFRGAQSANGFVNRTDSTLAMIGSDFQIAPAVTSYVIYSVGKRFEKTGTDSVAITNDLTQHYVYFDSAGVLQVSTSVWDIESDNVPVAIIYKDGATYTVLDERHGYQRNRAWHAWAHHTIGVRYESGLAGTFADTTFSIAQGKIDDEDIEIDTGGSETTCRLWYRNAAATAMRFESAIAVPWKLGATPAPQYDTGSGLADVTANRYFCSWCYATNDQDYPIYIVVGQAQYTTVAGARSDPLPSTPGQVTKEWKLLYRVIYQRNGASATYIEATDYREVSTGPGSSYTPASHTALTDRDATGSHPGSAISNTPAGGVAATDVQAAINELDGDIDSRIATHAAIVGAHHAAVTLGVGSAAELALSGQQLTLAAVLTPAEHTAIGNASPHHAAVTLNAAADEILEVTGQVLSLEKQDSNTVFAGPASGAAADPDFRSLVAADIPALTAYAATAEAEDISGQWDMQNALTTFGPAAEWRIGSQVLNLDFSGTAYDTKSECNAVGLRFSDSDTPFPTALADAVAGTWTHVAGKGWRPDSSADDQGPGILIPLARPGQWELELTVNRTAGSVAEMLRCYVGYVTPSGHVGAYGVFVDGSSSRVYQARLHTNDGDDTFTQQYTGAVENPAPTTAYAGFAISSGCPGVWDEQDDAWHYYATRQNAGHSYTPAYAFVQVGKASGTLEVVYLSALTLTYLL